MRSAWRNDVSFFAYPVERGVELVNFLRWLSLLRHQEPSQDCIACVSHRFESTRVSFLDKNEDTTVRVRKAPEVVKHSLTMVIPLLGISRWEARTTS